MFIKLVRVLCTAHIAATSHGYNLQLASARVQKCCLLATCHACTTRTCDARSGLSSMVPAAALPAEAAANCDLASASAAPADSGGSEFSLRVPGPKAVPSGLFCLAGCEATCPDRAPGQSKCRCSLSLVAWRVTKEQPVGSFPLSRPPMTSLPWPGVLSAKFLSLHCLIMTLTRSRCLCAVRGCTRLSRS
jgi:hypothetical protein